jgi:hypothetical protein
MGVLAHPYGERASVAFRLQIPAAVQNPEPRPVRCVGFGSQWDFEMAARSNALVTALASVVKMHPRLSAGLAFELGVMIGAFVKTARARGISGASAKLIEAVPLLSPASARKTTRKATTRKRKPARRAA